MTVTGTLYVDKGMWNGGAQVIQGATGGIQLNPRRPSDLVRDPDSPHLSAVTLDNYVPEASDPITVSVTITSEFGHAADDVLTVAPNVTFNDVPQFGDLVKVSGAYFARLRVGLDPAAGAC